MIWFVVHHHDNQLLQSIWLFVDTVCSYSTLGTGFGTYGIKFGTIGTWLDTIGTFVGGTVVGGTFGTFTVARLLGTLAGGTFGASSLPGTGLEIAP